MPCLRIFLALLFFPGCSPAQENARVEDRRPQDATESAWVDLDSPTSSARDAARKKIEAQPLRVWKSRALAETRPWASIEALLALCQACPLSEGPALRPYLCEGITTLRIEQMSAEQTLAAVRLTHLVCTRFGEPREDERQQMIDLWSRVAPPPSAEKKSPGERQIARELKKLRSLLGAAAGP